MRIEVAKRTLRKLTPDQLRRLDAWIHDQLIVFNEKIGMGASSQKRAKTTERYLGNKTYRLEEVRCGKKNCHCAEGRLHGPYWYAYWTEGGRTRSQYVGKKLPKGVRRRGSRHKVSDNLR